MDSAEVLGNAHQAFHRVIGITHHPTAQEKPFDIVAAIELHGEVYKLGHRQRGTRQVVAAAVDAVGAVVDAILVSITLSREIQRPSSAKLWQMPQPPTVFPSMPALPERTVPLEEQETSYFADSASIFSLLRTFSSIIPASKVAIILFKNKKDRQ